MASMSVLHDLQAYEYSKIVVYGMLHEFEMKNLHFTAQYFSYILFSGQLLNN